MSPSRYPYADRDAAGRDLAHLLADEVDDDAPLVLGLPRGGAVVAAAVAGETGWPWDVLVVRKVGAPNQPEFAVAAVAEGGVVVRNPELPARLDVPEEAVARERQHLDELVDRLRTGAVLDVQGAEVVLVDDGIATGATARAAVEVARAKGARRVVVGVPVASGRSSRSLGEVADAVVVAHQPRAMHAVGQAYVEFGQVSTDRVRELLEDRDPSGRVRR